MSRKHHHVVSAGYQRFFAEGERIMLITKATRTALPVGVRDNFLRKHFNSTKTPDGQRSDTFEDEWGRLEDHVLPMVATVRDRPVDDPDTDMAVKSLMAIHFARSFAMREMHDRIAAQTLAEWIRKQPETELPRLFVETYHRPPAPGELEQLTRSTFDAMMDTNEMFIAAMGRANNYALDRFKRFKLQFVEVNHARLRLGIGDNPLVVSTGSVIQLGPLAGLALGDADFIYMPLSPVLGVSLASKAESFVADVNTIAMLNNLIWRNARAHVACHPHHDWRLMFNVRPPG